jgi:hypothetical protein
MTTPQITATNRSQNWLIVPSVARRNDFKYWLVVLSGVAEATFVSATDNTIASTILILPDVSGPINWAVTAYGAPKIPIGNTPLLNVEQWVPYAAVGSTFDQRWQGGADATFDVNNWRPNPFITVTDPTTGGLHSQIFTGIKVDVQTRQSTPDGWTYFLPYHITLYAIITSAAEF